jgi:hypothetical protein
MRPFSFAAFLLSFALLAPAPLALAQDGMRTALTT